MRSYPKPVVKPWALVGLALMLLVLELPWVGACLVSICVHECCHLLALRMQQVPVLQISLGFSGARIETPPLMRRQELICALAGPAGSFGLCFLASAFPRLAVCSFFHGVCNLLPLYPLDGGRVLRCLVPNCISGAVEKGILLFLLLIIVRFTGLYGVPAFAVIIGRPLLEKFLAKRHGNSYNSPTIL